MANLQLPMLLLLLQQHPVALLRPLLQLHLLPLLPPFRCPLLLLLLLLLLLSLLIPWLCPCPSCFCGLTAARASSWSRATIDERSACTSADRSTCTNSGIYSERWEWTKCRRGSDGQQTARWTEASHV